MDGQASKGDLLSVECKVKDKLRDKSRHEKDMSKHKALTHC